LLCPNCGADAGEFSKYCPACGSHIVRATDADGYVGKTIAGKYRVEEQIGEGGMGKVYRARQLALDKPVVLKVLHASLLSDERTVARFQREAKAASRLNHPNSISILDFGQAEEALYIAMEFIAGKDLHHILSREWPLPEARVVRIVGQVLSALSDAHGAGVIHRDLKPENIMVEQRRDEPDFVKVLDFGIAKIQDSSGEDGPALTRAGFVCGTPEYMSPEQARGGTLDHRSDLYAVGVILYQLVTGKLPFESDSAVGYATKHLTEQPMPPSQRRPDARISPGMERLILRALDKDPNQRPQTAVEFRELLAGLENERPARPSRPHARRSGTNSQVTAPAPRRLGDHPDVRRAPPSAERTWVGDSTQMTRTDAGPTLEHTNDLMPTRVHRPAERKRTGLESGRTRAPHLAPAPAEVAPPLPLDPEEVGAEHQSLVIVRLVTLGLVLVVIGLVGYYFWASGREAPPASYLSDGDSVLNTLDRPLWEQEIPEPRRNPLVSARLEREGDQAHRAGNLPLAGDRFHEAFAQNPSASLSLKLGEVAWHRDETAAARGWWARHLGDHPDSAARAHILAIFPDLVPGRSGGLPVAADEPR